MIDFMSPELPEGISLRTFEESDGEFCQELHRKISVPSFGGAGLPANQLGSLLDQQYKERNSQWARKYPDSQRWVILSGEELIGEWWIGQTQRGIELIHIGLRKCFRGRGVGAALIRRLCAYAESEGRKVSIKVLKDDETGGIWSHLGFKAVQDAGSYYELEWRPRVSV